MPSNNENPTFLILQAAARQQQGQKETASSQSTQKVQTTTNQRTPNTKELSGKDILRAIANPLGTLSNQVSPKAKAGIGIANSVGKLPGYAGKIGLTSALFAANPILGLIYGANVLLGLSDEKDSIIKNLKELETKDNDLVSLVTGITPSGNFNSPSENDNLSVAEQYSTYGEGRAGLKSESSSETDHGEKGNSVDARGGY